MGPSQFVWSSNPDCYTCVEHGSKNRCGDLNEMHLENKHVRCVAVVDKRPVCLVHHLDVSSFLLHLKMMLFVVEARLVIHQINMLPGMKMWLLVRISFL